MHLPGQGLPCEVESADSEPQDYLDAFGFGPGTQKEGTLPWSLQGEFQTIWVPLLAYTGLHVDIIYLLILKENVFIFPFNPLFCHYHQEME